MEELVDAAVERAAVKTVQASVKSEQLASAQAVVKAKVFREKSNSAARQPIAERLAQDRSGSPGRRDERKQHLDRRCLAGPVGAQEAEDLASGDRERQIGYRDSGLEALEQSATLDRQIAHAGSGYSTDSAICNIARSSSGPVIA